MQEICRFVIDAFTYLGYNLYWTGLKEKRQYEVVITVCKSSDIVVDNILHQSERLMATNIVDHGCKIINISLYLNWKSVFSEKANYSRGLTKLKLSINENFNAISAVLEYGKISPFEMEDSSNDIELLLSFVTQNVFPPPMKNWITWHILNGVTLKIINSSWSLDLDNWSKMSKFITLILNLITKYLASSQINHEWKYKIRIV